MQEACKTDKHTQALTWAAAVAQLLVRLATVALLLLLQCKLAFPDPLMCSGNLMVVGLSLLGQGPLPKHMQEEISPLLCVVLSLSLSLSLFSQTRSPVGPMPQDLDTSTNPGHLASIELPLFYKPKP